MIPKIIHYCWFGNNPMPIKVLNNIQDWKKKLADYKFIEWNDSHLNLINNQYVKEAYQAKKFAFVADFFRVYALYNEGGIYLDTDITLSKSFDPLLNLDFFSCYENWREIIHPISTATLGAAKNNLFIKEILDSYKNDKFIIKGKPDVTTNVKRITTILKNKKLVAEPYNKFDTLNISSKEVIFPSHYFCEKIEGYDNYCVHDFFASWKDDSNDEIIHAELKQPYKIKFKVNKKVVFVKLKQETIPNRILFSFSFMKKKYAFIII